MTNQVNKRFMEIADETGETLDQHLREVVFGSYGRDANGMVDAAIGKMIANIRGTEGEAEPSKPSD
ncbi:hypothetical protein PQJ75_11800 [Rhodoplanes sp. TEM]|uniref:Uncharacterized protein n=1 Tax=Rhodoplanes tepidamans TaxID=200616 RepID=A0ABT5JGI1_RHOTP|nr:MULTISPECIES: hypothetical protein [Rhodoplanes]MDC7788682.1 hypothetical protein [Rhodoplanes tepidamans]MDC7984416.1 hypothetical protein [Rhodoplanes sp. TEM]MDQ0358314.1 hypothetical protein [Rhodoplanes tepidamans]